MTSTPPGAIPPPVPLTGPPSAPRGSVRIALPLESADVLAMVPRAFVGDLIDCQPSEMAAAGDCLRISADVGDAFVIAQRLDAVAHHIATLARLFRLAGGYPASHVWDNPGTVAHVLGAPLACAWHPPLPILRAPRS